MRKLLLIFLIIFAITLTGCHATPNQTNIDTSSNGIPEEMQDIKSESSNSDSSSDFSNQVSESEDSSVPKQTPEFKGSNPQVSKQPNSSSQQTDNSAPVVQEPAKLKPENPKPETPQPVPVEPNASASDTKVIADKVVEYINQYRREQGVSSAVRLSGLTGYAEYRSRQLVSNFAHDTNDERAAATALRYGEYVDPTLYGMTGEPYYTACAGEAIAKAGYTGAVDDVAKSLATLVRNSSEHWCYVGSSEYRYVGVGITYESGMWYCDIALTMENHG